MYGFGVVGRCCASKRVIVKCAIGMGMVEREGPGKTKCCSGASQGSLGPGSRIPEQARLSVEVSLWQKLLLPPPSREQSHACLVNVPDAIPGIAILGQLELDLLQHTNYTTQTEFTRTEYTRTAIMQVLPGPSGNVRRHRLLRCDGAASTLHSPLVEQSAQRGFPMDSSFAADSRARALFSASSAIFLAPETAFGGNRRCCLWSLRLDGKR